MDIQVWSDVVCPWCYLGKRRLESAIAELDTEVTVTYRAFQLDPSPVPPGLPLRQAMEAGIGSPARVDQMLAAVASLAAGAGLALDFDRAIAANTFDAHRLIAWAAGLGRQHEMVKALQRAHFALGLDIGSRPALAAIAGTAGLNPETAAAYLDSDAGSDAVNADLAGARELGITSVPFFLVDGKFALQGAQEPATLVEAFNEIIRREAVEAGR
ncbi:DsbA family oxidoreductase [Actinoplanes sp. LDG1-06]|uniref:DsbA family oxidoreductase n=1 Tax=Paractinoplanes ovalisporus TaxID=2810368 RepID=A0ABS2AAR1_9ACTN|nr:DsbA family oxidoreductase [Actinoplanes ovalisporus]MBM2616850.1 DsbA family oxidoreductase [Actinoplanes ovalisporus]